MPARKITIPHILMALLTLTAVISFFTKSHPPQMELVSPRQEYPAYQPSYPGDTRFADRVAKSYGLAMVLVRSQYSQKNAVALSSLRVWARDRFQQQPDFLHPLSMATVDYTHQNFIGACAYNLCAPIQYWLEDKTGRFIRGRISAFHQTDGFATFREAYFDLFGVDADSPLLLARYESDKGKEAIDVLLTALILLISAIGAVVYAARTPANERSRAWQKVLSFGWGMVAASYIISACSQNDLSSLVSGVVAAATAIYLFRPFTIKTNDDQLQIRFASIPNNWLALAYWVSYTLVVIQMVTWMRTGSLETPDPVSLLVASFNGNFLQDAVLTKRIIMQFLGVSWLLVALFAATRSTDDATARRQTEELLASLQGPI